MYAKICIACSTPFKSKHNWKTVCSTKCAYRIEHQLTYLTFECAFCGIEVKTRLRRQKYCSRKCVLGAQRAGVGEKHYPGLPTGSIGSIGELLVAADLLKRGYEVFRSVSPSTSCDLAILKSGKLIRVEVRTGYRLKNGKILTERTHRADILAINCGKDGIIYDPEL